MTSNSSVAQQTPWIYEGIVVLIQCEYSLTHIKVYVKLVLVFEHCSNDIRKHINFIHRNDIDLCKQRSFNLM